MSTIIYRYIKDNFKLNDLFSMQDLAGLKEPYQHKKEGLHLLNKKGEIAKLGRDLYYLPDPSGKSRPTMDDALRKRYLGDQKSPLGFYLGSLFLNQLSGTVIPSDAKYEIMTNKATSGKASVFLYSKRVILRKPYVTITKDNYYVNAFLSYVTTTPDAEVNQNYSLLANYIRTYHLSANDVIDLIPYFPSKTYTLLLSSNLYRSLWKH